MKHAGLVSAGRLSSSHKSQDSGFSDSGGSQNGEGSPHALTTNTEKKSAIKVRDMRSQVNLDERPKILFQNKFHGLDFKL